jgi:hypothetical protein
MSPFFILGLDSDVSVRHSEVITLPKTPHDWSKYSSTKCLAGAKQNNEGLALLLSHKINLPVTCQYKPDAGTLMSIGSQWSMNVSV